MISCEVSIQLWFCFSFFCMWVFSCPSTIYSVVLRLLLKINWPYLFFIVVYFWQFYSIGLYVNLYITLIQLLWLCSEIRKYEYFYFVVLFQYCLAVWGSLPCEFEFPVNLRIGFSISAGKDVGILLGNVLTLDRFGSVFILNI